MRGLTRGLARDLGPDRIRVNEVVPGWVHTDRQIALWLTPEAEARSQANQCLKGALKPDDIARMVLWLAADDSAGVQPCLQQHLGGHRGGSGLAVGAADADAVGENAAHGAQQLRPLKAGVMRLSPFQLLVAL